MASLAGCLHDDRSMAWDIFGLEPHESRVREPLIVVSPTTFERGQWFNGVWHIIDLDLGDKPYDGMLSVPETTFQLRLPQASKLEGVTATWLVQENDGAKISTQQISSPAAADFMFISDAAYVQFSVWADLGNQNISFTSISFVQNFAAKLTGEIVATGDLLNPNSTAQRLELPAVGGTDVHAVIEVDNQEIDRFAGFHNEVRYAWMEQHDGIWQGGHGHEFAPYTWFVGLECETCGQVPTPFTYTAYVCLDSYNEGASGGASSFVYEINCKQRYESKRG